MRKVIAILLFLLLLLPSLIFSQDLSWIPIEKFDGGLNDDEQTWMIGDNEATDLLNVYVDEILNGVVKRKGYEKANTTVIGSSNPIRSLHSLTKSDASKYMFAVSSDTIYGSADGKTFTSVKSGMSITYDVNWANLMDTAYCVDGSTWCQKFTAYDSCSAVTTVPRGRFIIEEGCRLWVAYASGYPSTLYHSDLGDGETWQDEEGDLQWVYIPGEGEITGLGKLQGSVIVYKPTSVWKVIGVQVSSEEDAYFVPMLINLSSEVGCVNHRTIQNFRVKGKTIQVFLGKDNIYATDGIAVVPTGDNIKNTIEDLKQATFASSYSWEQTSASDFSAGTSVNVSTSTLGRFRLQTLYWTETSSSDWSSGVIQDGIDLQTSPGRIQLSKTTEVANQTQSAYNDDVSFDAADIAQSFKPDINCYGTKIKVHLKRIGNPGDIRLYVREDDSGPYGDAIVNKKLTQGNVPTTADWVTFDFDDVKFYKDHRYWIRFYETGDAANYYRLSTQNGNPYARGNVWPYVGDYLDVDWAFKFYEQHYTEGHFRSQEKDLGSVSKLGRFYEDHDEAEDLSYTFKFRRKMGAGDWSTWRVVTDGEKVYYSQGDKLQYDIILTSNDGLDIPYVYNVKFAYISNSGQGNFVSQSHDCGTQVSNWGSLVANHTLNDGTIDYSVRTSSYTGGLSNATWYAVISGNQITAPVNRYVQWVSTLTTTDGTKIPYVDDVMVYWLAGEFSGSSPTSAVYDDRYHLFAMTSGSDINDIGLVLNEDGAWTKNDIGADSAVIYDNKFYTGTSAIAPSGGYVYQQDVGDNDDDSAIESYWQSKDYTLGYAYKNKTLRKLWTVAKRSGSYPLNISYIMDLGRDEENYDIWLSSGVTIVAEEKHIPSTAQGKFFRFKISNLGSDEPWELYQIKAGFVPAPGWSEP